MTFVIMVSVIVALILVSLGFCVHFCVRMPSIEPFAEAAGGRPTGEALLRRAVARAVPDHAEEGFWAAMFQQRNGGQLFADGVGPEFNNVREVHVNAANPYARFLVAYDAWVPELDNLPIRKPANLAEGLRGVFCDFRESATGHIVLTVCEDVSALGKRSAVLRFLDLLRALLVVKGLHEEEKLRATVNGVDGATKERISAYNREVATMRDDAAAKMAELNVKYGELTASMNAANSAERKRLQAAVDEQRRGNEAAARAVAGLKQRVERAREQLAAAKGDDDVAKARLAVATADLDGAEEELRSREGLLAKKVAEYEQRMVAWSEERAAAEVEAGVSTVEATHDRVAMQRSQRELDAEEDRRQAVERAATDAEREFHTATGSANAAAYAVAGRQKALDEAGEREYMARRQEARLTEQALHAKGVTGDLAAQRRVAEKRAADAEKNTGELRRQRAELEKVVMGTKLQQAYARGTQVNKNADASAVAGLEAELAAAKASVKDRQTQVLTKLSGIARVHNALYANVPWADAAPAAAPTAGASGTAAAELGSGGCLVGGECIKSGDQTMCMQPDGNLVWYG